MNYIAITLYLKGKDRKRRGEERVKKMKEKKKEEKRDSLVRWLIHVDVRQKPTQYRKVNFKKKKEILAHPSSSAFQHLSVPPIGQTYPKTRGQSSLGNVVPYDTELGKGRMGTDLSLISSSLACDT